MDNIRATADGIPQETLEAIYERCIKAGRIFIVGMRNGFGLAHYAAHYFSLIREDVRVLPATGTSMAHELSGIHEGDLVICFSFRRRPRKLALLLNELRASGSGVVLITDISASESAKAADHVIRCRCHSLAPFNSFPAAVTIIDYLTWSVAARLVDLSAERFRRIDHMVELIDDVSTSKRETPRR